MLVVDDDLRTREMYAAWLVYSGLRAAVAPDSEEAIEKAKKLRPDLITTDIGVEGRGHVLQFCAKLKKSPRTRKIPVIAVTAWSMGDCVEKARQAGCDLVLIKPCLPETLLLEIQRLLKLPAIKPKPKPIGR